MALKGKKSKSNSNVVIAMHKTSKAYLSALFAFCEGRQETAIERLTLELSNGIDKTSPKYYRLWIEVLASNGDMASLRALSEHLGSLMAIESNVELSALRGLIHLELDEPNAVDLYLNALSTQADNPYVAELIALQGLRRCEADCDARLFALRDQLVDYFHFQTLACVRSMTHKSYDDVIAVCVSRFPQFPLADLFRIDELVAEQGFKEALALCQGLTERFSANRAFRLKLAHLKLDQGLLDQALDEFHRVRTSDKDPDFVYGRSLVLSKQAQKAKTDDKIKQARKYMEEALTYLEAREDLAKVIRRELNRLEFGSDQELDDGAKLWLVKVPANVFNSVKTLPQEQISTLSMPLGAQPGRGDWCVIATDDYVSSHLKTSDTTWRLGAIYRVNANHTHPIVRQQCQMQLVLRPAISVPVDCGNLAHDPQSTAFVVCELDERSQKTIESVLEHFAHKEDSSNDMLSYFRKSVS
ncbi:MAG: tetratricopeptide repeat protein [Oligoflexales bacterium]